MQTPKQSKFLFVSLILIPTPLLAMEINPALQNIRDYPNPPHYQETKPQTPPISIQPITHQSYIRGTLPISPDPTPINLNSLN